MLIAAFYLPEKKLRCLGGYFLPWMAPETQMLSLNVFFIHDDFWHFTYLLLILFFKLNLKGTSHCH